MEISESKFKQAMCDFTIFYNTKFNYSLQEMFEIFWKINSNKYIEPKMIECPYCDNGTPYMQQQDTTSVRCTNCKGTGKVKDLP